jgi:parallel beta-helix repeat protein
MSPAAGVVVTSGGHGTVIRARDGLSKDIFRITADRVVLDKLHIDGNAPQQTHGNCIWFSSKNGRITDCFLQDAFDLTIFGDSGAAHWLLQGNRCWSTDPAKARPWGAIELRGAAYCSVVGNTIEDMRSTGIYLIGGTSECHHNTLAANTVRGCGNSAVLVEDGAHDNAVAGNAVYANDVGIWLNEYGAGAPGNAVTGNTVGSSTRQGIVVRARECVVADNIVRASGSHGIWLQRARGCSVTANVCAENGRAGLLLEDTSDCVCQGNSAVSNGRDSTAGNLRTGIGILQQNGACAGNVVTDNRCLDAQATKTQQYGMSILNAADNNLVAGNLLEGNGQAKRSLVISSGAIPATHAIPYRTVRATVGTTQVAVPHGLTYTPMAMTITPTSNGAVWRSAPPDSTNVFLQADRAGCTVEIAVG